MVPRKDLPAWPQANYFQQKASSPQIFKWKTNDTMLLKAESGVLREGILHDCPFKYVLVFDNLAHHERNYICDFSFTLKKHQPKWCGNLASTQSLASRMIPFLSLHGVLPLCSQYQSWIALVNDTSLSTSLLAAHSC
jgi:hypothetical protein